ncbi:MAG: VOC family protein [Phycisphaeraceae bacterium]|nr:VOC family protein [Phycisphaeraceae bacterium]
MRLDHIQLAMPAGEEAQANAFFGGLLGMQEVQKPEPLRSRGGCWFVDGDTHLHVGVEEPFSPQRKAHPAFLVEQLDDLAQRLEQAGYSIKWDAALPERKRFYTSDPFGNRIEFMNAGDGFTEK